MTLIYPALICVNLQDVEANLSHTDLSLVSSEFLEGWNNQRDSIHTKEWNN